MFKNLIVLYLISLPVLVSYIQKSEVISLYDAEIPNSKPTKNEERSEYQADSILIISKVSQPTLTVFLPTKDKATGAAVIICPGGGYSVLAFGHEGIQVASRFNESGIAAFVLKYRIPNDSTMVNKEIGPLQDAQRAIQILRSRAKEWGIDPKRIGIMGFSAGGHLASTAGTHFKRDYISNPDHINLRPDFMILIYPVISFKNPIGHMGSAHNLLGPDPSPEKIIEYSNELQVTAQTPPAFLVHAKDDDAVPYANSILFAQALTNHHVSEEVYLYEKGGHGFGMKNNSSPQRWMDLCIKWLGKENFLVSGH
jgi:acetyl esterase/lipase